MLISQLGFLILTGDQSLTLFSSLSSEEQDSTRSSESPSKHRRNSSRGSIRGFLPPEESLSSLNKRWVWSELLLLLLLLNAAVSMQIL